MFFVFFLVKTPLQYLLPFKFRKVLLLKRREKERERGKEKKEERKTERKGRREI